MILDATASIGLEKKHELADVIFFSSCKGLLGPTGLGFIAYKNKVKFKNISDFWNNIKNKQMLILLENNIKKTKKKLLK